MMPDSMTVLETKVDTMVLETPDNAPSTPVQSRVPPEKIRYRVHYEDTDGNLLEKSPYTPRNPELKAEPEEEEDCESLKPSVFDIVIHVTIRDIIETKSITTKAAATEAGHDHNGENTTDVGVTEAGKSVYKIKSVNFEEMVIRSPYLVKAIQDVVTYYPNQETAGETITVSEPYFFLLHHQTELEEYFERTDPAGKKDGEATEGLEGNEDSTGQEHFKMLQAFLDARWKRKIQKETERHLQTPPLATFEMLWMLFKPGTRVFASDPWDELSGYVVRSISRNGDFLTINLWYLEFTGTYLDRHPRSVVIYCYEGGREISSLPAYPMEIISRGVSHPLNSKLRAKLEQRGERCWKCIHEVFRNKFIEVKYAGPLLEQGSYKGRVVIDPKSFYDSNPEKDAPLFLDDPDDEHPQDCYWTDPQDSDHAGRGPWASYQNIRAENKYHELHKGHFVLMTKRMAGFLLKTRKWDYLNIDHVIEYAPDPKIVESLQIPSDILTMIGALVHKFDTFGETWGTDFIQNKGEGRIFLLHGPSGVGKTYTAECIAEYTGRPLLSLTCADIGTDEKEMESLLATWFSLSETWGAIMLIDEADVYFERRAVGQLQRNSLVSAFLRSMEYYRGILFLTTNRLGHMDDAILSRIHLIIEYSDLNEKTRLQIWKQFFHKLKNERTGFDVDPYLLSFIENDSQILDLKWNGREIRNAFQTAVSLAVHEAKTENPPRDTVILSKRHLESVAAMSKAFQGYMRDFKGDMAKRALLDGARMDESIRELGKERKRVLDELRKDAKARRA
ncbi:hypothetical protein BJX61DRAFT_519875 [Aspergillus egyptiacus]|nr:hypothetical protein BJX61DRAFT_519875 [Aspergillus egyptiacus]